MNKLLIGLALLGSIALAGCMRAGLGAFDDAKDLIGQGRIEQGLALMEKAIKENPRDVEFKAYYLRQKELYVAQLVSQAEAARAGKRYADAEFLYQRITQYDPQNRRAAEGLAQLSADRRHDAMIDKADGLLKVGKTDEAEGLARTVLAEDAKHDGALAIVKRLEEMAAAQQVLSPGLSAAFKRPITLEFRDANLKAIFEVISRSTNINFIFDRDVRSDLKSTIFVKNTTIEDVLNLLLVTNQLDKRVLNENTVLIYPNTPAKNKDYQDLTVKAFYLANADVKQTLNMIKTLVKTRDVFIDEKLNLLVMKDTPEAIRLAEKLISAQDRAEPEVMLEVEVMEVKRSRLLDLGLQWPNQFTALNIANQQTQSNVSGGTVVTTSAQTQNLLTVQTLRHLTGANIVAAPSPTLNLKKEDGDAQILANPRIRVKNKEKAKIHIGEKVPVITTTVTANVGVSENVSYLDVGLKLDVEPTISLDQEVSIKVALEVSNIVREIRSTSGGTTYQVGTRNAATHLRLKDGETQILAGLISDEDRQNANKVPGLGDLPLLGHLFSSHRDETTKTEIVLLITPRIVRNLVRPDAGMSEFASGTESAIGAPPLTLRPAPMAGASAKVSTGGAAAPIVPRLAAPAPAAVAAAPLSVALVAPTQVARGQEFTVVVNAAATTDIAALAFDLIFDPAQVEVVRVAEGAFLKQNNGNTRFVATPVEGSGRQSVSLVREGGGASGSGAVAVVAMRAVSDENSPATLSLEVSQATDATGRVLPVVLPPPSSVSVTP